MVLFKKRAKYFFIVAAMLPLFGSAQQVDLVTYLDDSIKETSGLICLDERLITHNDSGGEAALYEIDTISGTILRKTIVANANNIDWEDICLDSNYIYIGDFGNNSGSRTNLCIYRLLISDYLTSLNDTVFVDTILFNYADQTDFTSSTFATNFDAEALISFGDSLWIFTKNWGDYRTNIYAVSKQPGTYSISKTDSLDAQGLVTGGVFDLNMNKVVLTGYTFAYPFIIELTNFIGHHFSNGIINRYPIDLMGSLQVEAIAYCENDFYYLTAEENGSNNAAIFRLNTEIFADLEVRSEPEIKIYPNPSNSVVNIDHERNEKVEIYDSEGKLVLVTSKNNINVSKYRSGCYYIRILALNQTVKFTKMEIIK